MTGASIEVPLFRVVPRNLFPDTPNGAVLCPLLTAAVCHVPSAVCSSETMLTVRMLPALAALLLLLQAGPTRADIFSSTSHLRNLMYLERHLVNSMSDFLYGAEQGMAEMKR